MRDACDIVNRMQKIVKGLTPNYPALGQSELLVDFRQ